MQRTSYAHRGRVWSVLCLIFLVAGCASHTQQGPPTSSAPAPGRGASVESVAGWIEAGSPADPEEFRTVDQDGVPSQLSEGEVAFRERGDLGPRIIAGCITSAVSDDIRQELPPLPHTFGR
ncbi:hypothetical protein HNP40_002528 [Mycobacteroides chelonae]|nr:hypothetical protein [Mycobacteroides chelonae]